MPRLPKVIQLKHEDAVLLVFFCIVLFLFSFYIHIRLVLGKGKRGLHVCLRVFSLSDVLSSKNKENKYLGLWYCFSIMLYSIVEVLLHNK